MDNLYKKDANIVLFTVEDGDDFIAVNINHKKQGHRYYSWMEFQPELESMGFRGVGSHDDCYFEGHNDVDKLKSELESNGFAVTVY